MRKEDFKEIKQIHFKTCREIVDNGQCECVECVDCPFEDINSINHNYCSEDYLITHSREFLKVFEDFNYFENKKEDYYNAKDDKEKRKSLIPVEVMPYVLNKDNAEELLWGRVFKAEMTNSGIDTILPIEKVLKFGAEKYGANQWQDVPDAKERFKDALQRHTYDDDGKLILYKTDADSGLKHVYHALCNIMFLMWFELKEKK